MARVLVVDGDVRARELITKALSADGYDVRSVPDVYRALAEVRDTAPDLLISDVAEPDGGGLWLLRAVRARFPDLPIVMMAEQPPGSEDHLHTALSLGASDTVLKPVRAARIREVVDRLLAP